jgi:hypothetical protein
MNWIMYLMAGVAVSILVASVVIYRRRKWVDASANLNETMVACRSILALVANFQQHRGMSSAWLAGDQSFKWRLDSKGYEIDGLIPALREVAKREGGRPHPCLTPNDLALFQFNWGQLREKLGDLSVEQSIAQHSFLVDQLLQWLAALGESRVELLLKGKNERSLVRNYASRLPALTECLGQARALGTSVAARRGCSAVARVRLMFLIARAEALLKQAGDTGERGQKADQAMLAVYEMARVIRTQMLLSSGISVAAPDYFAIASAAIDSVFAWIAECDVQLTESGSVHHGSRQSTSLRHV